MNSYTAHENSEVRQNILDTGQRIMAGKGFSAVGLNEILVTAGVPKGSFYHYFSSKDAFGEALLEAYFEDYLAAFDAILSKPGVTMAQRLMTYWQQWQDNQSFLDCQGKCLAVKLGSGSRGSLRSNACVFEARHCRHYQSHSYGDKGWRRRRIAFGEQQS